MLKATKRTPIKCFVINLKNRNDRKNHIEKEFANRNEFTIEFVEPIPHKVGAVSLWNTMKYIISEKAANGDDFVLICEDDHQFTEDYLEEHIADCIADAKEKGADVLSGGVTWFSNGFAVSDKLFWVDRFNGTQFIIIFRKFFDAMLRADFGKTDAADRKICEISNKVFFINPFISIQKDFGYSDATPRSQTDSFFLKKMFTKSSENVQNLIAVCEFYKKWQTQRFKKEVYDDVSISTYIINTSPSVLDIKKEFFRRTEFDLNFVDLCVHQNPDISVWLTMQKIAKLAISSDDDIIIICDHDHKFTEHYSKDFLFRNITEAHEQGAEILLGSVRSLGMAFPVTKNRAWLNHFYRAKFIILYRSVFQKILNEPFDDGTTIDTFLSFLTSNKMILFPFISMQNHLGQIDYNAMYNEDDELITSFFENADAKLTTMYDAAHVYNVI